MAHVATASHWWMPRGDDPYDEEDFVKALYRFCKEEATDQELWAMHAKLAEVYGDTDVQRFFGRMVYVAEEHEVHRNGKVEKRTRYSAATYRSIKFRMKKRLIPFLDEYYRT